MANPGTRRGQGGSHEEGEWLGAADVSELDDGSRFLSPEEIDSVRAEFGLDRYCS